MSDRQDLQEAVAAMAQALDDEELDAAAAGKYGEEVRLLVTGEKVRRRGSAA